MPSSSKSFLEMRDVFLSFCFYSFIYFLPFLFIWRVLMCKGIHVSAVLGSMFCLLDWSEHVLGRWSSINQRTRSCEAFCSQCRFTSTSNARLHSVSRLVIFCRNGSLCVCRIILGHSGAGVPNPFLIENLLFKRSTRYRTRAYIL